MTKHGAFVALLVLVPGTRGFPGAGHLRTRISLNKLTAPGEADQTSHQGKGGEPTSGSCGQGRARCSRGRETFSAWNLQRELRTSNSTSLVEIGINGQINSKNRESPRGMGTCFLLFYTSSPAPFPHSVSPDDTGQYLDVLSNLHLNPLFLPGKRG